MTPEGLTSLGTVWKLLEEAHQDEHTATKVAHQDDRLLYPEGKNCQFLEDDNNDTKFIDYLRGEGTQTRIDILIFRCTMIYQSPKAYGHLKIFFLPNKRTIKRRLEVMKFDSGFQTDILSILEKRVSKMKEQEKVCVFLVDKISLKEGLSYDELKDRVDGLEDLGVLGRTEQTANQGWVFMLRGLTTNWKQPLAYFFARDSTLHGHLSVLIRPCLQNYLTWVCMLSCVLGIKGYGTGEHLIIWGNTRSSFHDYFWSQGFLYVRSSTFT